MSLLFVAAAAGCAHSPEAEAPHVVRDRRPALGTYFEIQVVAAEQAPAHRAIDEAYAEVERLEALLSEWRETSEISAVNRAAGQVAAVEVGPELLEVVERAAAVSDLTEGAFDLTFAGCGRLWSFREPRIPGEQALADCLRSVGYRRIEIDRDRSSLRLPGPGMRIGIAGIGQGYIVDRVAAGLEARGFTDYLIDCSGDIRVGGRHPDRPWSIAIVHPRRPGEMYGRVELSAGAVATSGDYMSFFERDGRRYHHILDPRTGQPAGASIAVTVVAPDATLADALGTGLFVLGPERGLAVVERLPGVEALFFDAEARAHPSSGFRLAD